MYTANKAAWLPALVTSLSSLSTVAVFSSSLDCRSAVMVTRSSQFHKPARNTLLCGIVEQKAARYFQTFFTFFRSFFVQGNNWASVMSRSRYFTNTLTIESLQTYHDCPDNCLVFQHGWLQAEDLSPHIRGPRQVQAGLHRQQHRDLHQVSQAAEEITRSDDSHRTALKIPGLPGFTQDLILCNIILSEDTVLIYKSSWK